MSNDKHTVEGKYPKLNFSPCLFLVGTKLSLFEVFRLGFEILECGQLTEHCYNRADVK